MKYSKRKLFETYYLFMSSKPLDQFLVTSKITKFVYCPYY